MTNELSGDIQSDDVQHSVTSFDTLVGDNTVNKADIAAHYTFSPERLRYFINGSRYFVQYNSPPYDRFSDDPDYYTLKPNAGDVLRIRTGETFRYVVGYDLAASQAFKVNQSLQTGDKVIVGYGEPDLENDMASADGWFVEFVPELPDDQAYITTYRDGELLDQRLTRFEQGVTDWRRIENVLNWYNVGHRQVIETYTNEGIQYNPVQNDSSVDAARGPETGNHPVVFAVEAGTGTSNLELECGSVGVIIKGNAVPLVRNKTAILRNLTYDRTVAGNWEPLFAIRRDPDDFNVDNQLTNVNINEVSSDVDAEVLAVAVDPSKTDATGFSIPSEHSRQNSAIQHTSNISTFPDLDGNVVSNASNPGGYQLGYASRFTQAQGTANVRRSSTEVERKRNINNGDYVVFLGKAGASVDFTVSYTTEQNW